MSVHIMAAIWRNPRVRGNAKLLLLALADMANDEGLCWPSIATLRERIGFESDRGVQQLLAALEAEGQIERAHRPGSRTLYRLIVPEAFKPASARVQCGASPDPLPGGVNSHSGVNDHSPRTAIQGRGEQPFRGGVNSHSGVPPHPPNKVKPSVNHQSTVSAQTGAPAISPKGSQHSLGATCSQSLRATCSRGTRLPEGFLPDPADLAAIGAECPGLDLQAATRAFVDYWRAVPGVRGLKLDWRATWRNWMRREFDAGRSMLEPRALGSDRSQVEVRDEAAKARVVTAPRPRRPLDPTWLPGVPEEEARYLLNQAQLALRSRQDETPPGPERDARLVEEARRYWLQRHPEAAPVWETQEVPG